jgi:hypothetical protein
MFAADWQQTYFHRCAIKHLAPQGSYAVKDKDFPPSVLVSLAFSSLNG